MTLITHFWKMNQARRNVHWGYKNIFLNNTGVGLYVGNATTSLLDKMTTEASAAWRPPATVVTSRRIRTSSTRPSCFRLAGDSPLLGYSTFLGDSGHDLDGNAAPSGGAMDLGAYYETIFVDGFEAAR